MEPGQQQSLSEQKPVNATKNNNKIVYLVAALVVLLIVIGGFVAYKKFSRTNANNYQAATVNSSGLRSFAQGQTPAPTPNAQSSSNSSLDQQSTAIDNAMNNLTNDLNSMDQQFGSQSNDSNPPQ